MKSAIALLALAGLCSGASAGDPDFMNVSITLDSTSIMIGQTTTATMVANFGVAGTQGGYLSVANFDVIGTGPSGANVSGVVLGSWHMPDTGASGGTASGSDILGLKLSQSTLFGTTDNTQTGLVLATWTITATSVGSFSYEGAEPATGFAFGVIDNADGTFALPTQYDSSIVTSETLNVTDVPAPASLAAIGLGLAFAGKRRR